MHCSDKNIVNFKNPVVLTHFMQVFLQFESTAPYILSIVISALNILQSRCKCMHFVSDYKIIPYTSYLGNK